MTLKDQLHRKPSNNDILKITPSLLYSPCLKEYVVRYISAVIFMYKIFYKCSATVTSGSYWEVCTTLTVL